MKKWITLAIFALFTIGANAQILLNEDFEYSGALLSNGWSLHSGSTSPINTTTGLTYTGYSGSGIGNAADLAGTSDDINLGLTDSVFTDGASVYLTAMVNITETAAVAGGYFLHLGNRATPTSFSQFAARVFAKTPSIGVVNFGVSNTSTGTFGTTNFATNTTYLLVIKYTISTAGVDNVKLWVLTSGTPTDEASAGTPEAENSLAGVDAIDAVALRQSSGIPKSNIDGIQVSTSWPFAALPVELTSFSVNKSAVGASLIWSTKTETNNNGFEVEKSIDQTNWNKIGFVSGKGTTTEAQQYSFKDTKASGTVYYRLKQFDNDGKFQYSGIETISIVADKFELIGNYPNPFNPATKITFSLPVDSKVRVSISNVLGQELNVVANKEFKAGKVEVPFNASNLATGMYFYTVTVDGKSFTKTMTLMK